MISCCILVCHRRDRPAQAIFLKLEPCDPTIPWDIDSGVNLPWTLSFSRVHHDYFGVRILDMYIDIVFMLELARSAQACSDIVCHRLATSPCELDRLKVHRKEPGKMLRSSLVEELSSIAEDGGRPVSEDVPDLKALHENASRKGGASSSSAAGLLQGAADNEAAAEGHEKDEYDFEKSIRSQVQAALTKLHGDDDRNHVAPDAVVDDAQDKPELEQEKSLLALLAENRARERSSSSASASQRPASSPSHMAWLDNHISYDTNPRYQIVKDSAGRTVGQLQPMIADNGFRSFAVCYCDKHKTRCTRSRGWSATRSATSGEEPSVVNRVLAYWLLSADQFSSTGLRMQAPRR